MAFLSSPLGNAIYLALLLNSLIGWAKQAGLCFYKSLGSYPTPCYLLGLHTNLRCSIDPFPLPSCPLHQAAFTSIFCSLVPQHAGAASFIREEWEKLQHRCQTKKRSHCPFKSLTWNKFVDKDFSLTFLFCTKTKSSKTYNNSKLYVWRCSSKYSKSRCRKQNF